jgi:hypothetical protein
MDIILSTFVEAVNRNIYKCREAANWETFRIDQEFERRLGLRFSRVAIPWKCQFQGRLVYSFGGLSARLPEQDFRVI